MSASSDSLDLQLLVDQNQHYAPLKSSTILVENTAEAVIYRTEPANSKSTTSLAFTVDCQDFFLGRDMYVSWSELPLTVTRSTPTTSAATKLNFHSTFFKNYDDLCLTQFALLNAINTITVVIDGVPISTTNIADKMAAISQYYDKSEVHRHFDASNTNIMYSNLVPPIAPWIPSYSITGQRILVKGSALSENDSFSATVSDEFNSRTPLFTFDSETDAAIGSTSADVTLHGLGTWLPFNVLGINGDDIGIYHASKVVINIQLHENWVNRVFSTKRNAGVTTSPFSFKINTSNFGNNSLGDVSLSTKLYRAPQYIRATMDGSKDKYIQSYSVIEQESRTSDIVFKSPTQSISSTAFDLRAIPKRIYVSLTNKKVLDNDYLTDATHYCRWDSMEVELNGVSTILATGKGSEQLYNICKANGLEMNKQTALYTHGFSVCLDTSTNLGCPSNSYVGLSSTQHTGKTTLRIRGEATRLHHDTEAANFTSSEIDDKLVFLQKEKIYELRVILVYAGFMCYNLMGRKFQIIESLTRPELDSLSLHVDNLYHQIVPKMNILGGSWLSSLAPMLQKFGKGSFRVVQDLVTNKNNLRDKLIDSYNGAGFDNHSPIMGGKNYQSNIINGGKSINGWESR